VTHPVLVLLALPLALLLLILFAVGRVVREGVEFYSNGDCYEGEFHKGRCNGVGIYNFFGKRKYEGEARGNRYRGQYRQAGSHGIGAQTCSDGTS
jgi:hypothetical protein